MPLTFTESDFTDTEPASKLTFSEEDFDAPSKPAPRFDTSKLELPSLAEDIKAGRIRLVQPPETSVKTPYGLVFPGPEIQETGPRLPVSQTDSSKLPAAAQAALARVNLPASQPPPPPVGPILQNVPQPTTTQRMMTQYAPEKLQTTFFTSLYDYLPAEMRRQISPTEFLTEVAAKNPSDKFINTVSGVASGTGELTKSFLSPFGIATLNLGGLSPGAQKAVALAYATQMTAQNPEVGKELGTEMGKPPEQRDTAKIARLITEGLGNSTIAGLAAAHGLSLIKPPTTPTTPTPHAIHQEAEKILRPVQQPGGSAEGPGQMPPIEAGPPTGPRSSPVPGTPPGQVPLTPPAPPHQAITPEQHAAFSQVGKDIGLVYDRVAEYPGVPPLLSFTFRNLAKSDAAYGATFHLQTDSTPDEVLAKAREVADKFRSAVKPPEPEPALTAIADTSRHPTVEIPLSELSISADVPNFKGDADPVTGVVPGQELGGTYERVGTAPIVVWQRLNGKMEVITGRHRLDLARRTDEKTIPAQVMREADGFTQAEALTFDAQSNIRDGQGSIDDYAHYFKNTPALNETEARARGLLSRTKGRDGWELGKNTADDLYSLWGAKKIATEKAVAIARAAPGNADLQALGIKQAFKGKSPAEIENFIKAVQSQTSGGTSAQVDLFGRDDSAIKLAEKMAKKASARQEQIANEIRAVQGAAKRPELAAKHGVDVKDPQGVLKRIGELKAELDRWQNWSLHPDLVTEIGGRKTEAPQPRAAPGELLPAAEQPFNLVGQEAKFVPPKTEQTAFGGETLTQNELFGIQEVVREVDPGKSANAAQRLAGGDPAKAAKMLRRQVAIMESDPKSYKSYGKEQKARLKNVIALLDQRAGSGPELVGMGGAVASEFEHDPRTPTSIKNAVVDQERAQRGLPPAIEPARRAFGTVWDSAMTRIDKDPGSQDQLIAELKDKPRALNDVEDALLLHRQIDLQNEYGKAARDMAQAYDDGRMDAVEEGKGRLASFSDQLFELYEIGKHAGTETARGLNARKMLAYEDHSLASMTLQKRVAKGGTPLTPEEQTDITRQQKEIVEKQKDADEAVTAQQTRQQEDADEAGIQATIRRAKSDGAKRGPRPRDIGAEHNRIVKGLTKRLDEGEDITNLGNWIQKLARLFVEQGVTERDPLIDAVHEVVRELVPDFSRRDTMDAISGYGDFKQLSKDEVSVQLRDLKGQMQQVAKLEDIMAKQPPLKTGLERRAPSDEERRLIKLVNDAKRRFGIVITDPARQLQSALGARKTYYRNQIADLEAQIANREKFIKERAPSPTDPELEQLKIQRDEVKKKFDQMFPKPEKTNAELLAALKKRLQGRIEDYQQRLAEKDFAPRPRRQIVLDKEALRLQAEAERAKEMWQRGLIQDRLAQRPAFQKGMDKLVKWRQAFVISGIRSIFKLASASIEGMVLLPAREVIGGVIGRIPYLHEIAARAPSEGGFNVNAEAKAITETWSHLLSDFSKNIRGEKPDFEQVYGPWRNLPPELQNYVGFLHGALKSPLARNVWTRSFFKRMEFAARHGVDTSDPLVQMEIGRQAWEDSSFWRFQNRNLATSMYRQVIARMQAQGYLKTATAVKLEFPIINVPTNIVARTFESVFGSVTGSYRAARALRAGIENLKPEQADLIMRNLKTGSLGLALTTLGYLTADQIGGYYQPGKKQKPGVVPYGAVRMWNTDIPAYLLHNPFIEAVQFGATIRHVGDAKMKKTSAETNGLWTGLAEASWGAYEQIPFVRESVDLSGLHQPTQMRNVVGEHLRSLVIPMALQWIAEQTDKGVQRRPQSIWQHLEMGIPGLRQNVPLKKAGPGAALSAADIRQAAPWAVNAP